MVYDRNPKPTEAIVTNTGHRLTGIGAAMLSYALSEFLSKKLKLDLGMLNYVCAAAALSGANAPDWLEVATRTVDGQRKSLIPHRTITHWLPLWIAGLAWGIFNVGTGVSSFVIGFTIGGLMHLAMDWPNPMGIPIWVPWRRVSGRLWKSGKREILLVLGSWGLGWGAIQAVSLYS